MSVVEDVATRRMPLSPPDVYGPVFGPEAPVHQQILAWSTKASEAVMTFMASIYTNNHLEPRLVELIRLRIAFHNQCRTCMATRNQESGVTEELVCSLERPEEAPDLTDAEKAALKLADLMSIDHFSLKDEHFERLHEFYTPEQIVELGVLIGGTLGMGRLTASWDIVENLPERFQKDRDSGFVTPWGEGDVLINSADMSGKTIHAPGIRAS
ncbi:carboxymuconolactone decarboxylase family protein [Nocardioides sp. CPCC 206347]|uniref:carboxymuconolactone decarboxylase family protein n=1 Tax=unclassified Nocardioides TaxID=2615069 RepID=UPI0036214199